jgi:AcrR family transcriptional regulator
MQRMSPPSDPAAPDNAPPAPVARSRPQLSPQDWIDAALAQLVDHTIDAVRVDVLARRMKVTRGSFYWHFTDRDDLLKRLLESWRRTTTEQVIARFQGHGRDPAVVLRELLHLPTHGRTAAQASSVELAIREWARRDPTARAVLEEVDTRRLNYFAECFMALGHGADEARHRAFVLYGCIISDSLLSSGGNEGQREARLACVHGLLVPPR